MAPRREQRRQAAQPETHRRQVQCVERQPEPGGADAGGVRRLPVRHRQCQPERDYSATGQPRRLRGDPDEHPEQHRGAEPLRQHPAEAGAERVAEDVEVQRTRRIPAEARRLGEQRQRLGQEQQECAEADKPLRMPRSQWSAGEQTEGEAPEPEGVADEVQRLGERLGRQRQRRFGWGRATHRTGVADAEGERAPGGVGVFRHHTPGDEVGAGLDRVDVHRQRDPFGPGRAALDPPAGRPTHGDPAGHGRDRLGEPDPHARRGLRQHHAARAVLRRRGSRGLHATRCAGCPVRGRTQGGRLSADDAGVRQRQAGPHQSQHQHRPGGPGEWRPGAGEPSHGDQPGGEEASSSGRRGRPSSPTGRWPIRTTRPAATSASTPALMKLTW